MDVTLGLWSDGASLFLFDPKLFEGTKPAEAWPYHKNPGVRDGAFAMVSLQGDGGYYLRLTDGVLTSPEREILNDTVGPLGVSVESGRLYASGMDWPGEQEETYIRHGAGAFIEVPPGDYEVVVHELRAAPAEEQDLPDYVAEFRSRSVPFQGVTEEPSFTGGQEIEELIQRLNSESRPGG